jgi:hypothetical protein
MKYNVIKILEHREVVLFDDKPEAAAIKLMSQLIEQHAEDLIRNYPDINESDAINIAETQFLLVAVNTTAKPC